MPEPHHRCAECTATLAAHEDPQVETCSAFKVPSAGGALDELAACVRTVGSDGGRPIQVVHYADARRAVLLAEGAVRAATKAEREKLSAQLIEANEDLEAWGAFDFLLTELADLYEVSTDQPPMDVVHALIRAAYVRRGKGLGLIIPAGRHV